MELTVCHSKCYYTKGTFLCKVSTFLCYSYLEETIEKMVWRLSGKMENFFKKVDCFPVII